MKLTIIRLENFSAQDNIDLGKIWRNIPPHLYASMTLTGSMLRGLMSAC